MQISPVVLVITLLFSAILAAELYTDKYDNIDLDNILNNDRLLQNYANCILDKGKCTPDGEELKSHIKEALDTECAKCSEKHKAGAEKVIVFLAKNKQDVWEEVQAKYDPEGKYREKYADLIKKASI